MGKFKKTDIRTNKEKHKVSDSFDHRQKKVKIKWSAATTEINGATSKSHTSRNEK